MEVIPRHFNSQDWMTLVFLSVFLLMVLAKSQYPHRFYHFFRILFSERFFKESEKTIKRFSFFGYALFLAQALIISLGLYFFILRLDLFGDVSVGLFLKIFAGYTGFMVIKFLIEKMLGTLFSVPEMFDQYIFFKMTYKNFLAIGALPILIVLGYLWHGTPLILSVIILVYILLNLMFLGVYYKKNSGPIISNLFYFILYLCTFEIAPYYIVYKVIV